MTQRVAKRPRVPWSKTDVMLLRIMALARTTDEIAEFLERSPAEVRAMARVLSVDLTEPLSVRLWTIN
jgi:hypothetical protein